MITWLLSDRTIFTPPETVDYLLWTWVHHFLIPIPYILEENTFFTTVLFQLLRKYSYLTLVTYWYHSVKIHVCINILFIIIIYVLNDKFTQKWKIQSLFPCQKEILKFLLLKDKRLKSKHTLIFCHWFIYETWF